MNVGRARAALHFGPYLNNGAARGRAVMRPWRGGFIARARTPVMVLVGRRRRGRVIARARSAFRFGPLRGPLVARAAETWLGRTPGGARTTP